MQSIRTRALTSDSTPEQVFTALLGVVQNRDNLTLFALNNDAHKIAFTSGKTALSWGQEYIGHVAVNDTGKATVLSLACGTRHGAPKALLDGWKNSKAADKVLADVDAVLNGSLSVTVDHVESFTTHEDGTTGPITTPGELA